MNKRANSYKRQPSMISRVLEAAFPLACLVILIPMAIVIALINDVITMGRDK